MVVCMQDGWIGDWIKNGWMFIQWFAPMRWRLENPSFIRYVWKNERHLTISHIGGQQGKRGAKHRNSHPKSVWTGFAHWGNMRSHLAAVARFEVPKFRLQVETNSKPFHRGCHKALWSWSQGAVVCTTTSLHGKNGRLLAQLGQFYI